MPSEFRETAEDLNTTESVQVDGNAIRRRVDAFTGSDHYRFTIDGIEYDAHWAHDTRRLLDENTRLNTALDEVRSEASRLYRSLQQTAKRVEDDRDALAATVEALSARLTAKNTELDKLIREAAADKAKLSAVEAPREYRCPWCTSTRWTSVTVEGRAMAQCALCEAIHTDLGLTPAPEMPRPPATMDAPAVSTAGGSTEVPEPENPAQASKDEAECPLSTRVDGLLHNWVFAGSGYIVCSFCDQMKDGLKGLVVRPGRRTLPVQDDEAA